MTKKSSSKIPVFKKPLVNVSEQVLKEIHKQVWSEGYNQVKAKAWSATWSGLATPLYPLGKFILEPLYMKCRRYRWSRLPVNQNLVFEKS
jgi:hypothetical protein